MTNKYENYLGWFSSLSPEDQRTHEQYCKDNMTEQEYNSNPIPKMKSLNGDKLKRFEQAIVNRNDVKLAQFYNEIKEGIENHNSVENLLAKSEWILLKSQSENHRLMIYFLEMMEAKT